MGWAKYTEDNIEMWEERCYRPINEDRYPRDAIIQVCAFLPATALPVEISVKVTQEKEVAKSGQTLKCKDCGRQFVFTERDQAFFEIMGYCPPKRCKKCRVPNRANHIAFEVGRG